MSTQTLLEMTQEILTSMQSDEVDSITDTGEAEAVATIIRRTYWDLFGILDLPEHYTTFRLTATDANSPTVMTVPTNVMKVVEVRYNNELEDVTTDYFTKIPFQNWDDFLDLSFQLNEDEDYVETFTYTFHAASAVQKVFITNNANPAWYTTPDDRTIVFDSYNSEIDTFLTAAKTACYGLVDPTFTFTDAFTPDLNARQFALLVNEAKAQCFAELKQVQNAKAEQRARHLKISSQRTGRRVENFDRLRELPNYGRK